MRSAADDVHALADDGVDAAFVFEEADGALSGALRDAVGLLELFDAGQGPVGRDLARGDLGAQDVGQLQVDGPGTLVINLHMITLSIARVRRVVWGFACGRI